MQQNHCRSFSLVGVTDFGVFEVRGFHDGKNMFLATISRINFKLY
jgi:hypothetical protein